MRSVVSIRGEDDYIPFMSITKLFVVLCISFLEFHNKLNIADKVAKYIPGYQYSEMTISDVITHTSGLDNKWPPYENYNTDPDHRRASLRLEITHRVGEYHYNNSAYDILCDIIEKITKVGVDKFIGNIFFNKSGIDYSWYSCGKPYGGFGLSISKYDAHKIPSLLYFLKSTNYRHILDNEIQKYIGHSGSGGQFLYFDTSFSKICFLANTGEEPFNSEFTEKDVKKSIKFLESG